MTGRRTFRELTSPDDAARAIADLPIEPDPEGVPLREARGRVLAERVDAGIDVPGFDRASLDGYALNAADTTGADEAQPARLSVVGAVHAGETPTAEVGDGEAVAVSTGAVMPPVADAMVPIERLDEIEEGHRGESSDTDGESTRADDARTADDPAAILVRTSVAPGENVMPAGADVAAGQRALGPGTRLTAREIGLLAAIGAETVPVRGRPTVGVLSTGEELVQPGGPLDHDRGEIYDVNTETIATAVAEAGGEPRVYPRAGDDAEALAASVRSAAAECDLLLTSGSTSAGAVDVLHSVLESEGELLLHGVAIKPGKPTLVGRLGDCGYVGLPGYPVSAAMVFRTLVAPAIREAAGVEATDRTTVTGELAAEARFEPGRRRLLPVGLVERRRAGGDRVEPDDEHTTSPGDDGTPLVYPVDKGSGATTSLARADGLVTVPAEESYVPAGETVTVELFSPGIDPPPLFVVGEDDPGVTRLLDDHPAASDRLAGARYLADGTEAGVRRLRDGIPDVAVAAEPLRRSPDGREIGGWTRRWGLVVPSGNPAAVEGLETLVETDLRLANRAAGSGLRAALDATIEELAAERGAIVADLEAALEGYGVGLFGHESPARRVLDGDADAGLGLEATARRLDLDFVPLGTQRVVLYVNPDREETDGVAALETALEDLDAVLEPLAGYDPL